MAKTHIHAARVPPIKSEVDWMVGQKVVLTTTSYVDDDPDSLSVSRAKLRESGDAGL